MDPRTPRTRLTTHEVTNQPPPFVGINLFNADLALQTGLKTRVTAQDRDALQAYGARVGSAEVQGWAEEANRNPPVLVSFDRYGHRLDEVRFHPAYHALMQMCLNAGVVSRPWSDPGGHAMHAALMYLTAGADGGVCCPMSMTYAAVPVLQGTDVGQSWAAAALAPTYDARCIPAREKQALTFGMAMTEKQGGSDLRANTTRAEQTVDGWRLTGHKWFCSAPMSDAFLTLAQTKTGLTCFLVPRWRPDGADGWARNEMQIMRLKDKMGDRSNASSEIEYHGAYAEILGQEGRGISTIINMVQHTRLDCAVTSAGAMRAALMRAIWHVSHRSTFQQRLIDLPSMRRLLADLALESEAATQLALRLAGAFDNMDDPQEAAFARLATPVAKYWICKRQPGFVYEALECFGGSGFVEETPLARYFRAAPLNAIWEGSGNVIALDILRVRARAPESVAVVLQWLEDQTGSNRIFDAYVQDLKALMQRQIDEAEARRCAETLGLALAAGGLAEAGLDAAFHAFCAARIDPKARGLGYGTQASALNEAALLERASPLLS